MSRLGRGVAGPVTAGLALLLGAIDVHAARPLVFSNEAPVRAARQPDGSTEPEEMQVGDSRFLELEPGDIGYTEGSTEVVRVVLRADRRILEVLALKPGETSIVVASSNGPRGPGATLTSKVFHYRVYERHPDRLEREVRGLLEAAGLRDLEVKRQLTRVTIGGTVSSAEDQARVDQIVHQYPNQVTSFVVVDPTRQRTNIKLTLYFVQLRKDFSNKMGVNWPGSISANATAGSMASGLSFSYDLLTRAATSGQLVIASNLLPSLDLLAGRGWAKVKNVVSVVTTNGGVGEYHSGGEVNVKIATSLGNSTIQRIPFGLQLNVQPRFNRKGDNVLSVAIEAEKSALQNLGQEVPGRTLTRTKTTVHVKQGDAITLTRYEEATDSVGANGVPGLMRVPLLGYLFRSETLAASETENVLFIVPTVEDHVSKSAIEAIDRGMAKYNEYGSKIVY